jgi:hypothetical protein
MDNPDTIAVNIELERKVYASGVAMFVEIRGDSLVSGSSALQKAREVRDLVAALAEVGIEERNVQLVAIRAEVSSGIIGSRHRRSIACGSKCRPWICLPMPWGR